MKAVSEGWKKRDYVRMIWNQLTIVCWTERAQIMVSQDKSNENQKERKNPLIDKKKNEEDKNEEDDNDNDKEDDYNPDEDKLMQDDDDDEDEDGGGGGGTSD